MLPSYNSMERTAIRLPNRERTECEKRKYYLTLFERLQTHFTNN